MRPHCRVCLLTDEGVRFFGPGPAALLERVEALGSLHAAAAREGLSYTKALRMIRDAEAALGLRLLVTESGGKNGGGSTLTDAARELLARYRAYERAAKQKAGELFGEYFTDK